MNTLSDETLLERVLTGELSESDPQVALRCESSQAFAAELLELRALVGRLEEAGAEERETLSTASRLESSPGAALVEAKLREVAQQEPFVRPSTSDAVHPAGTLRPKILQGPWMRLLAAAGVLIGVFFLGRSLAPENSGRQGSEFLSGNAVGLRFTADPVPAFAWSKVLAENETLTIEFYDEDAEMPFFEEVLEASPWIVPEALELTEATRVELKLEISGSVIELLGSYTLSDLRDGLAD